MRISSWFLFVGGAQVEFSVAEMRRIGAVVKGVLPVREAIRAAFLRHDARLAAAKRFQATALAKAIELAGFAPDMAARLGLEPAFCGYEARSGTCVGAAHPGSASRGAGTDRRGGTKARAGSAHTIASKRRGDGKGTFSRRVVLRCRYARGLFAVGGAGGDLIHHYGLASVVLSFRKEAEVR
jgi:hypothetical protein